MGSLSARARHPCTAACAANTTANAILGAAAGSREGKASDGCGAREPTAAYAACQRIDASRRTCYTASGTTVAATAATGARARHNEHELLHQSMCSREGGREPGTRVRALIAGRAGQRDGQWQRRRWQWRRQWWAGHTCGGRYGEARCVARHAAAHYQSVCTEDDAALHRSALCALVGHLRGPAAGRPDRAALCADKVVRQEWSLGAEARPESYDCVQAFLGAYSFALSESDWRQLPYIGAALAVAGMWSFIVFYASCRFKVGDTVGGEDESPPPTPRKPRNHEYARVDANDDDDPFASRSAAVEKPPLTE
jgi:hypothetical protein